METTREARVYVSNECVLVSVLVFHHSPVSHATSRTKTNRLRLRDLSLQLRFGLPSLSLSLAWSRRPLCMYALQCISLCM